VAGSRLETHIPEGDIMGCTDITIIEQPSGDRSHSTETERE